MTFVKFIFVLLILVPVAVFMWHLVNKLIVEFTDSVKERREQERAREAALKERERKRAADQMLYGRHHRASYSAPSPESEQPPAREKPERPASGIRHMADKRKRRKERRMKKGKEQ